MSKVGLILTCEHASNRVPAEFRSVLRPHQSLLRSHWGYDIGASKVSDLFAEQLNTKVLKGQITRLLVDLNRRRTQKTLHHPRISSKLDKSQKEGLLREYYEPHYREFQTVLTSRLKKHKSVLHLGIHSFTPRMKGEKRKCDLAFLYDSKRKPEKRFATRLCGELQKDFPHFVIRRNFPYDGGKSGLVGQMRDRYSAARYLGVEIEINQKFFRTRVLPKPLRTLIHSLCERIQEQLN